MICVASMPRSGSSLLTQLLHRSGVDLGPPDQLMPASINNTDGFWENMQFVRLNERLLAANGGRWFAPPAKVEATAAFMAEAESIVAQFAGREPWAWKDPRNAVTLPFWKRAVPSMKVVVCVRHPAETASSLVASTLIPSTWLPFHWSATRADSPLRLRASPFRMHERLWDAMRTACSPHLRRERIFDVALELWRVYNVAILEQTTPAERVVVHYEATLIDPRRELERVLAFAGIPVAADRLDEAVRVVSPRLRHQRAAITELPPELARLYAQLCGEAEYAA